VVSIAVPPVGRPRPRGGNSSIHFTLSHGNHFGREHNRDLAAAGIAKTDEGRTVDFHALRHTAITWAAASGAPTRVIQAVARHASIRTTERYTDLRLFDVKGAIGRMPLPSRSTPAQSVPVHVSA
jgi:integrase